MNNPLVSIIIPTYNRAELIEETLKSIQEQTYLNWECIIIDDGSSDNTNAILKNQSIKDKRFVIYKNERKKGAPGSRNTGIKYAKGAFIYFFDSDDIMYSNLIDCFLNEFRRDNQIDFCCCEYDFFKGSEIVSSSNNSHLNHNIESHLEHYGFTTQSFFTKKNIIESIGLWNENLHRLQDVEYFSRLFSKAKNGFWIDKILFKIRIHQNNISSSWNKNISESLIFAHKILALRFQKDMSDDLKIILGRRITAFSISALASGFWLISWRNFWFGLKLLPTSLRKKRLKTFIKLSFKKPFVKNMKEISMYY